MNRKLTTIALRSFVMVTLFLSPLTIIFTTPLFVFMALVSLVILIRSKPFSENRTATYL